MSEKFTFTTNDRHDISKDEWRQAVRDKHGKYRGVATDEFVRLARLFIDGEIDGQQSDSDDEIVGMLKDELEQVRDERDQLREENERLREMLVDGVSGGASPGGTPSSDPTQTKNGGSGANSLSQSDSAGDYDETSETLEAGVWDWADYSPGEYEGSIPVEALGSIHETHDPVIGDRDRWEGRELPSIDRDDIDELPGEPAAARVAVVAAVARNETDTIQTGRLVSLAEEMLDVGTKDYLKNVLVLGRRDEGPDHAAVNWLAGEHPDPGVDAEWVTDMGTYQRLVEEQAAEAESEAERFVSRHVRAALGDPRTMPTMGGRATIGGMAEAWEDSREDVVEAGAIHPVSAKIVAKALRHLAGTSMAGGRLSDVPSIEPWDEFWSEWATDGEALVEWLEDHRGEEVAEAIRDEVVSSLEQYEPEEMRLPDDEGTDEEADGWETVDEAEVEGK